MSAYINFYVAKDKHPVCIWYSSASSELFQIYYHEVPYEKCELITNFGYYYGILNDEFEEIKESRERCESELEFLKDIKGTDLEDVMEKFGEIQSHLDYLNQREKDLNFIRDLLTILENAAEDGNEVWVGIECPPPYYEDKENE